MRDGWSKPWDSGGTTKTRTPASQPTPPRTRAEVRTLAQPAKALPNFGAPDPGNKNTPAGGHTSPAPTIGRGEHRPIRHRMTGLERDLVVMDTEWTGGAPQHSTLIALAIQRLRPDGTGYETCYTVNPQVPISSETRAVHGISDTMVRDLPTFPDYAHQVEKDLVGADLGGYGIRNDITVVEKAFSSADITWNIDDVNLIDGLRIWQKGEPRGLVNAHEAFVGRIPPTLRAHDAGDDVRMTVALLEALAGDQSAADVQQATDPGMVDPAGKFVRREDGEILLNFGAHRENPARQHLDFLEWMLRKDFPPSSRKIARTILETSQPDNKYGGGDQYGETVQGQTPTTEAHPEVRDTTGPQNLLLDASQDLGFDQPEPPPFDKPPGLPFDERAPPGLPFDEPNALEPDVDQTKNSKGHEPPQQPGGETPAPMQNIKNQDGATPNGTAEPVNHTQSETPHPSDHELAIYQTLRSVNDNANETVGDQTLTGIARKVLKTVHNNLAIDWTKRESIRAKLRISVRRVLQANGYPQDKHKSATDKVMEQAEALYSGWRPRR